MAGDRKSDIVLALEDDVASGSLYFRLLLAGVSPEALDGISIVYIDTRSTPGQLVDVVVNVRRRRVDVDGRGARLDRRRSGLGTVPRLLHNRLFVVRRRRRHKSPSSST